MNASAQAAVEEIQQLDERLKRNLEKVPDDRLQWSPAPSARNPLHLVAHCGFSLDFIRKMLEGEPPFPIPTTAGADAQFLEMESKITTREQALEIWSQSFDRFVAFLKTVNDEDMNRLVNLPFGMDPLRLRFMLGVGSMHTREHVAQLEYVQTAYGDRDW